MDYYSKKSSPPRKPKKPSHKVEYYHITDEFALEGYYADQTYLYTVRNSKISQIRKQHDDYTCQVCNFRLKINDIYIIECHHLVPFSKGHERITNINNLVCYARLVIELRIHETLRIQ